MKNIKELKEARQMCQNINGFEDNEFNIQKTQKIGAVTVVEIKRRDCKSTCTALFENGTVWDVVMNDATAFDAWVEDVKRAQID